MRLSRIPTTTLLVGALALSAVLTGCSLMPAARDAETQEVTEAGNADVFSLRVGDCTNDTSGDEASSLPVVPCADAHDNEVYFAFDLEDGEWPGDEVIQTKSEEVCLAEFAKFIGTSYEESALEWWPMTPTQGSWESLSDREVYCFAYDPAGLVTGSLAGAAR